MKSETINVAIIGAGIAGLTTALALSKYGISSKIFERTQKLSTSGAGIQLSPNALKPLEKLKLSSAINAVASAPRAINICDGLSGNAIGSVALGATAERRFTSPYLVIHRGDLQQILVNSCANDPKIEIQLGAHIKSLRQHQGKTQILDETYDYIIGADGVHSKLREQLFGVTTQQTGMTAWRATIAIDKCPDSFSKNSTTLCLAKNAHLVTYPIASGMALNCVLILKNGCAPTDSLRDWHSNWRELHDAAPSWSEWPLLTTPQMKTWHQGNVALIGDAAHSMLPFAAQGGAMAIEDAFTIAKTIAHSGSFSDWEQSRMSRVGKVIKLVARNQHIYHMGALTAFFRNRYMATQKPEKLLSTLDWLYGFDVTR